VQAAAFDEDGDELGMVCDDCLSSPERLLAHAHPRANHLRRWADALDTLTIEAMCSVSEKDNAAAQKARAAFAAPAGPSKVDGKNGPRLLAGRRARCSGTTARLG